MLTRLLTALFGTSAERDIKKLQPIVDEVNAFEARMAAMTNDQLRQQTARLKQRLSEGATLDELLPEAFASVREAAKRVAGLRHFDVQIIGGIVLHRGSIAEMVTGEGKTLVATLPAYLNALLGRGVHIVTVNDYLARRDSEWMRPIFEFLGLTVGLIQQGMSVVERQVGYRADITYATNNELGFDYLRDNMARHPDHRVQRDLFYAIVDEVDSILIDEARTPLIISGRPEKSTELYIKIDDVVRRLRKGEHYEADEKQRHIVLSDEGMEAAERLLGIDNLYSDETIGLVHMLEQAIKAHNFFRRDREYIVQDGEVLIVDEFTGRIMEGRRYSDGLHQALEAKERVPLKFESQTIATITYQNFFRLYEKIAGMTGTAATEAVEFGNIYKLDVVQIPTNLPLRRNDHNDLVFATEKGKFKYLARRIKEIHETGRPILVGTVSIEKSEIVSRTLEEQGITDFQVLNAKHHEREAAIIANAGKPGAITIATNMAGRGTDIKLGEGVRELGGLVIIGTERHDSRRIDNQLRGRCGRQGDPGDTYFFVSLEDEVARLFGGDKVRRLLNYFGTQEMDDQPLDQRMVSRSIERAQRQVEEHNYEIRKHVLEYDEVMDKQRKYIYAMRREVLEDRDVSARLREMFDAAVEDMAAEYAPESELPEKWDLEGLEAALQSFFGFAFHLSGDDGESGEPKPLVESLKEQVHAEYARREALLADQIRENYRRDIGGDDSAIDFSALARRRFHDLEKMVILRAVDDRWIDHLYEMDHLRESVRLRAFGQRDPLLEYKKEGFELFQALVKSIEDGVVQSLFRLTDPEHFAKAIATRDPAARAAAAAVEEYSYISADKQADSSFAAFDTERFALGGRAAAQARGGNGREAATQEREAPAKPAPVRAAPKVGPNEPCPCGSGKKYKKCCGRNVE